MISRKSTVKTAQVLISDQFCGILRGDAALQKGSSPLHPQTDDQTGIVAAGRLFDNTGDLAAAVTELRGNILHLFIMIVLLDVGEDRGERD